MIPKEFETISEYVCKQTRWTDESIRHDRVEDIVRCKDCKHNYNTVINHGKMHPRCDFTDRALTENDFCSRGERQTERSE